MDLVPYMYYEKQEAGSQLCAQHCLNNLLQQHTYSEWDLAEIARKLDQAENAELNTSNQNRKSYYYDDTGFFSISVLERALQIWDLELVRWRGEAMRPYQEHPEQQAGFILNLASHWIPLRRFSPHPQTEASTRRWYNLNSFLPNGPEWISPTYLRLFLTQAEQEGYSVFVLRRTKKQKGTGKEGEGWGDGGVGVLPECEADRIALALGEPVGRDGAADRFGLSKTASSSRAPLAAINPDQPGVDPSSITPPQAPSPPPRRRKRQEDLIDPDNVEEQPVNVNAVAGSSRIPGGLRDDDDDEEEYHSAGEFGGNFDFTQQSRSYDDEDAALQAALKASMEDVPAGWQMPSLEEKPKSKPLPKPLPKPKVPTPKAETKSPAAPVPVTAPPPVTAEAPGIYVPTAPAPVTQPKGAAAGSRFKEEIMDDDDDTPAESLSPEEIRRRRLARFGQ